MTARSSAGSTAARSRSSTASRRPCPQPSPCPPTSSASRTAASWWTSVAELVVTDLRATAGGKDILRGIDLVVRSGEVHAVMGPNGSGKSTLSHVLMGKPGYEVNGGSVTLDGVDLLSLPTWRRAQAGLFLAMQYPIEVPGVSLTAVLTEAL